ncbi:hypothetical protein [Flavobacterium sp.]|uniref:hypothetical protein n=1 Tax=Flavobacterium sp. TaxID=239 RepID=UPI0037BF2552
MKDATFYILTEFYRLLNGVISVPVFSTEKDTNSNALRYVVVSPSFDEQEGSKDRFNGNYYVNIDINDIVPDNAQSWEAVVGISNEILDIICPNRMLKALADSADFAVLATHNIRSRNMPIMRTDTEMIMRKVLEFEIIISQK